MWGYINPFFNPSLGYKGRAWPNNSKKVYHLCDSFMLFELRLLTM